MIKSSLQIANVSGTNRLAAGLDFMISASNEGSPTSKAVLGGTSSLYDLAISWRSITPLTIKLFALNSFFNVSTTSSSCLYVMLKIT